MKVYFYFIGFKLNLEIQYEFNMFDLLITKTFIAVFTVERMDFMVNTQSTWISSMNKNKLIYFKWRFSLTYARVISSSTSLRLFNLKKIPKKCYWRKRKSSWKFLKFSYEWKASKRKFLALSSSIWSSALSKEKNHILELCPKMDWKLFPMETVKF